MLLSALLFAGCARPDRRQFQGGYIARQLDRDLFEVTFQSNLPVDPQTLERSLLRHAAQVTLANGFTHFDVINWEHHSAVSLSLTPQELLNPSTARSRSALIRCLRGDSGLEEAFDAQAVLKAAASGAPTVDAASRQSL